MDKVTWHESTDTVFGCTGNHQHNPLEDMIRYMRISQAVDLTGAGVLTVDGDDKVTTAGDYLGYYKLGMNDGVGEAFANLYVKPVLGKYGDENHLYYGTYADRNSPDYTFIGGELTDSDNFQSFTEKFYGFANVYTGTGILDVCFSQVLDNIYAVDSSTTATEMKEATAVHSHLPLTRILQLHQLHDSPRSKRFFPDSVMAVDGANGALKWGFGMTPQDVYTHHSVKGIINSDRLENRLKFFQGINGDVASGMTITGDRGSMMCKIGYSIVANLHANALVSDNLTLAGWSSNIHDWGVEGALYNPILKSSESNIIENSYTAISPDSPDMFGIRPGGFNMSLCILPHGYWGPTSVMRFGDSNCFVLGSSALCFISSNNNILQTYNPVTGDYDIDKYPGLDVANTYAEVMKVNTVFQRNNKIYPSLVNTGASNVQAECRPFDIVELDGKRHVKMYAKTLITDPILTALRGSTTIPGARNSANVLAEWQRIYIPATNDVHYGNLPYSSGFETSFAVVDSETGIKKFDIFPEFLEARPEVTSDAEFTLLPTPFPTGPFRVTSHNDHILSFSTQNFGYKWLNMENGQIVKSLDSSTNGQGGIVFDDGMAFLQSTWAKFFASYPAPGQDYIQVFTPCGL